MAQQLSNRHYPVEILESIASLITNRADLCSFARCNTTTWAIENEDLVLAEKALAKYTEFHAPGLIDGTMVRWNTFTWRDGTPADERPSPSVILAAESDSLDMLKLVVVKALAAGCGLDARCERTDISYRIIVERDDGTKSTPARAQKV
jgi:hypothetical protein